MVYADQNRLRVFDGVDGTVVFETEVGSGTRLEYPIIAVGVQWELEQRGLTRFSGPKPG